MSVGEPAFDLMAFDLSAFDLSAFDLLVVDLLAFDQSSATHVLVEVTLKRSISNSYADEARRPKPL